MANRYANLVGSNKIKDEYQKINQGFDKVEQEMDEKPDNSFAKINDVEAEGEDAVTIEAGTGITVTTTPEEKKIRITATGEATPGPHGPEHNHDGADPIPDLVQLRDDLNAHLNEKAQDDVHSLLSDGKIIEESGSNANGQYVRFADGTQICYATITDSGEPYLTVSAEQQGASGDYQAAYEWTFPANFPSNVGRVRAFATGDVRQGQTARNTIQSFVAGGGAETIRGAIRIWCREPFNRIYNFTLFAIGRWR